MPGLCARSAAALCGCALVVLPVTAPAFEYRVPEVMSVAEVGARFLMKPWEVGRAIKRDPLPVDLEDDFVWVPRKGRVPYIDLDTLETVADQHDVIVDEIVRDPRFTLTRLKKGAVLTLPNMPMGCEIVTAPPLKTLPKKIAGCVPPILVRPERVQTLFRWTGDLAMAYFPGLAGLVAGLTALGLAVRRARALPPSWRRWDE